MQLINQERASQGIQPLAVDQRLTQAACEHSELMVEHKVLSHQFRWRVHSGGSVRRRESAFRPASREH